MGKLARSLPCMIAVAIAATLQASAAAGSMASAYADVASLNLNFTLADQDESVLSQEAASETHAVGSGDTGFGQVVTNLIVGENFGPGAFRLFASAGETTAFAPPPDLSAYELIFQPLLFFKNYSATDRTVSIKWNATWSVITRGTFSLAEVGADAVESIGPNIVAIHPLFHRTVMNGASAVGTPSNSFDITLPGGGVEVELQLNITPKAVAAVPEPSSCVMLGIGGPAILLLGYSRRRARLKGRQPGTSAAT